MSDKLEGGGAAAPEARIEKRKGPYSFEDLELGMEGEFKKTVTADDILNYAIVSGDENPVHLDPAYAAKTVFKEPIAHGMLTASFISAVFGMEMPGPGAIYVSQTLNFKAPVKIGDVVTTKVRVTGLDAEADKPKPKPKATFECQCLVNGKPVLEGVAVLMVPTREQRAGMSSIRNGQ